MLSRLGRMLAAFGPGLVVMLADADVGNIVTAAQSGASWGYRLLLWQLLLAPILYVVQELAVRLGLHTGRGHAELIRERFGPHCAWLALAALAIACMGTLMTELSGVAGIGALFHLPESGSLGLAVAALLGVMATGAHRRVERLALLIGLLELAFVYVAWRAAPHATAVARQALDIRLVDGRYMYLVAANIGAAIVPWMVFYQQSAVARRGLGPAQRGAARLDTALGAALTQLVTAAVLVATAASVSPGVSRHGAAPAGIASVGAIAAVLTPALGARLGRAVFGAGVLGGAMAAAIVASLALAWGFDEVAGHRRVAARGGWRQSLPLAGYAVCVLMAALIVSWCRDLVALNVGIQALNALLLPLVFGFLVRLAATAPPHAARLRGWYLWLVLCLGGATCALGLWGGLAALL